MGVRFKITTIAISYKCRIILIMEFLNAFSNFTIFQISLFLVFGVLWLIRLLYLLLFTARIAFRNKENFIENTTNPISVLLTFRNEEENIKRLLPKLMELPNENIELVAIDDFSQDNSLSLLGLYRQRYQKLKISSLSQETKYSEKLSQNIALKSAQNDWVLFVPVSMVIPSGEWLSSFQSTLSGHSDIIVGYSNVAQQKGWVNRLIRTENMLQFVKSVAYTMNGIGFVYSENNVAFKKEHYFKLGGYGQFVKEPYVNLELLINSFIKKKSTSFGFDSNFKIQTKEKSTLTTFQEILRKAWRIEKHLPAWKKRFLEFERISELIYLPLLSVALFLLMPVWQIVAVLGGLLVIAHMLIIKITLNRLNERKIFITSLVYSLIMPYYKVFARWNFNKTRRRHKWKNKV